MSLDERMAALRGRVEPDWNDARAERVFAGVPAQLQRRRTRRIVAAVSLVLMTAGVAVWRGRAAEAPPLVAHGVRRPLVNPRRVDEPRWKRLAERGDWGRAWDVLRESELRDEPGELVLAAEVARRSGHPQDALLPLKLVLDQHASDARAAHAALLLGRVLMEDLSRPRDAALAFAQVRTLAGHAALDEDALAHEAEAWWRAGDIPHATACAREYLRLWPDGAQLGAVRHLNETSR
jgi:transmembrane sensor